MWSETQHDTLYPPGFLLAGGIPRRCLQGRDRPMGQLERTPLRSAHHSWRTGAVISLEKMSRRAFCGRAAAAEIERALGAARLGFQGPGDYTVQWVWCFEKQCSSCFIGHSWMLELLQRFIFYCTGKRSSVSEHPVRRRRRCGKRLPVHIKCHETFIV